VDPSIELPGAPLHPAPGPGAARNRERGTLEAESALYEGLDIARRCQFLIFRIDLLNESARSSSRRGAGPCRAVRPRGAVAFRPGGLRLRLGEALAVHYICRALAGRGRDREAGVLRAASHGLLARLEQSPFLKASWSRGAVSDGSRSQVRIGPTRPSSIGPAGRTSVGAAPPTEKMGAGAVVDRELPRPRRSDPAGAGPVLSRLGAGSRVVVLGRADAPFRSGRPRGSPYRPI